MSNAIVIGGGLSGIVAALRMQQAGTSPLVLEKSYERGGMGNARISGGLVHLAWRALDEDPDLLYSKIIDETEGEVQPEVARVLADNSGRCLKWLMDIGVDLQPKDPTIPYQRHALFPHRPGTGRRIRPEFGPDKLMMQLWDAFQSSGGEVNLGHWARSIERSSKGWIVRAICDGTTKEFAAERVLIADGGFQANNEMLTRYVGPNAGLGLLRAMPSSTGDGLTMLLEHGAAAAGLGRVYGHIVARRALEDDELWPYPSLDKLALEGALVNRQGRLFTRDAANGVELVTLLLHEEDPRGFSVVFDERLWQTAGRDNPYNVATPNPDLVARGADVFSAPTIRQLAKVLDFEARAFESSIDSHNCREGAIVIERPPFYAVPIVPGITFTMGGVAIDASTRVLDHSGEVIPGLFASGSAVGGVQGGPHGGYLGGLAVALILGIVAGEAMTERVTARKLSG